MQFDYLGLDKLSTEEIVKLIKDWAVLHDQLIGNLYPAILDDQITFAIKYLKEQRNYNWHTE